MTRSEAEFADDEGRLADQVAERPDDLALALTELSGVLLTDEGLERTLQRVAQLACRTMPGCTAAGVTLVASDGTPETAAFTHDVVLEVDRRQYAVGDGPCIDALRERRINSSGFAEAQRRWPEFTRQAVQVGFRSFLAAPLIANDEAIGALNLYSGSADGFEELDDALIGLFSGQASVALANARLYRSARTLSEQLQEALDSRAVIEQAKGILMAQERVDADTAFALLRQRSQNSNRKLRDVAREVVDGVT
jgi:GAF domain-containing protein